MFNIFINVLDDETEYPSADYRGWLAHQRVELEFRGSLRNRGEWAIKFKREKYEVFHLWRNSCIH